MQGIANKRAKNNSFREDQTLVELQEILQSSAACAVSF